MSKGYLHVVFTFKVNNLLLFKHVSATVLCSKCKDPFGTETTVFPTARGIALPRTTRRQPFSASERSAASQNDTVLMGQSG